MSLGSGIPRRMKEAREDHAEMTQVEVEEATDLLGYRVSENMVSRYENGVKNPTVKPLLAFCIVTRANPTWVLTGQGDPVWSPEESWGEEQQLLAARLERLAAHLRIAADEGIDLVSPIEVLSEGEMEPVDLPEGNEPSTRAARREEVS